MEHSFFKKRIHIKRSTQLKQVTLQFNQTEKSLKKIEWLLTRSKALQSNGHKVLGQPYGSLAGLNTCRRILNAVGEEILHSVVRDYLDLMETSSVIYEKNGDYAMDIFTSGWCRFLNQASFNLCGTTDNKEALASGKWHCHESCWTESAKVAIETDKPVDTECRGGIHIYAVPLVAKGEAIGAINFAYGSPPTDDNKLQEIAELYRVPADKLKQLAITYLHRPPYIIDIAKQRLHTSAILISAIVERKEMEDELTKVNQKLMREIAERKVIEAELRENTIELEAINKELVSFSYSVSHDLRSPLRSIDGFSQALLEDYADKLDSEGRNYLQRVRQASQRMGQLIDDLLKLSRVTRQDLTLSNVDLTALARQIIANLHDKQPGRSVECVITPDMTVQGDARLIKIALENLLGNAWKFTGKTICPKIEFGVLEQKGATVYYISDNGAGFEMEYSGKMFGAFQRLHNMHEFPGNGIGLATVQRIIHRHGGQVWAEGAVDQGATFYFTLNRLNQNRQQEVNEHG